MPITEAHSRKFPVLIAYTCIAKVNPHGKKKVNAPVINAAIFGCLSLCLFIPLLRNFGNPIWNLLIFGDMFVRLSPKSIIILPTTIVSTDIEVMESLNTDPKMPSNHPNSAKPTTLPILK